jgi:hypothetical protein
MSDTVVAALVSRLGLKVRLKIEDSHQYDGADTEEEGRVCRCCHSIRNQPIQNKARLQSPGS